MHSVEPPRTYSPKLYFYFIWILTLFDTLSYMVMCRHNLYTLIDDNMMYAHPFSQSTPRFEKRITGDFVPWNG